MNDNDINDIRLINEFKGISFSKYQKNQVKKELINNIYKNKIENACYWSAELICAGHYVDLWDVIINYICKYIHIGNPKLPIYIQMRFNNFRQILINGYVDNELNMRNNTKIRNIFCEVICVLCLSPKKHSFETLKIKEDEFDITQLTNRLKADHINYSKSFFLKDDPKELFIPLNEFAYNISKKSVNTISATYWLEWIIQFEIISKKQKQKIFAETRSFIPVLFEHQKDLIWLIWDSILKETNLRNDKLLKKIIYCLLDLFCIKYTNTCKNKRKYVLYFAITLLTEQVNYKIPIINKEDFISSIVNKIHLVYKDIKKNEISPNTDYLFTNVARSNLEKTIEKIEKMNEINQIQ